MSRTAKPIFVGIYEQHHINNTVHLGARTFEELGGEVVQSVAFVLEKGKSESIK